MAKEKEQHTGRVTFEHPLPAHMMAIDGTWRRACTVKDVSDDSATLVVEASIEGLALQEFFLLLSSTGLAYRRCQLDGVNGAEICVSFLHGRTKKKRQMTDLVSSDAGPATFSKFMEPIGCALFVTFSSNWWKAVKVGKAPELPAILVIEDDAAVQGIVEDALNEGGFEAALASTGEEAVTLLKGDHTSYRALITDIKLLGRYDGWAVARAAREIDPVFPIVYITGNAAHDWPALGVPNSIMLQKPFAPAQLVTAISQLLNIRQTFGPATT